MIQPPSPIVDEVAEVLLNALTKLGGLATATVIRVDGVPRPFAWDRLGAIGEISAALTFAVCIIALALYATNIWLMLRGDVDKCQPALIVFAWIQFFLSTLMLDAWLPAAAGDK